MPRVERGLSETIHKNLEPDYERHSEPDIAQTTVVIYSICVVTVCQLGGGRMDVLGVDEVSSVAAVIFVLLSKSYIKSVGLLLFGLFGKRTLEASVFSKLKIKYPFRFMLTRHRTPQSLLFWYRS